MNATIVLTVVVAVIAIGLLLHTLAVLSSRKQRVQKFIHRTSVTFYEWYDTYYSDRADLPPELVKSILNRFSDDIGVSATQLRPSDQIEDLWRWI